MKSNAILLSGLLGPLLPQRFAEVFGADHGWSGITPDDLANLSHPDLDSYWHTWDDVLSNATFTDPNGDVWYLHQNRDLYIYCPARMNLAERFEHGHDVRDDLVQFFDENPGFEVKVSRLGYFWLGPEIGEHSRSYFSTRIEAEINCADANSMKATA